MNLLYEGGGIIAVDKPPGIAVIPGRGEGPDLKHQLEEQRKERLWVVHRLDRDTSGILVFALNADAHRAWSMAFEAGDVHKRYLAIVQGRLERERLLDWPIGPARKGRMKVSPQGKAAQTRVRPVELFANATLVEAEPLTGRSHQIRVHLSYAGHPLITDHQYQHGDQSPLIARTPLHASKLEHNDVKLECGLPEDMRSALAQLTRAR